MSNFLILEPRCVFIHIPRTGGTTIRKGIFAGNYEGPFFGRMPKEWDGLFKFAFVRNPFDRLVSAWKLLSIGSSDQILPVEPRPRISLDEFFAIATNSAISPDPRLRTFESVVRHHTLPQTHPVDCLDDADFVGRYENFETDLRAICAKLKIEPQIPHLNRSQHQGYRAYFDDGLRSRVEQFYRDDLEQLGYEF